MMPLIAGVSWVYPSVSSAFIQQWWVTTMNMFPVMPMYFSLQFALLPYLRGKHKQTRNPNY